MVLIVAIVASIFGIWFIAVVLWALIFMYFIAWLLIEVLIRVQASIGEELSKQKDAVIGAVAEVVTACPESCRGDLSPPTCAGAGP
ncbi:MAG: hypothetical protein QM778_14720 [Myxococcales bacterium]